MLEAVHPHPAWKRLRAAIEPLVAIDRLFTYAELSALAGVDVRTPAGRKQFLQFRKRALHDWGMWFACDRKLGYRVSRADEHPGESMTRSRWARRQMQTALAIAAKTSNEGATPDVVAQKATIAAGAAAVLQACRDRDRKLRAALSPVARIQSAPEGAIKQARS